MKQQTIKCMYCGKSYPSPDVMRKNKCHSHPKGAWRGYCTPDSMDEFMWKQERASELHKKVAETIKEEKENAAVARCAYRLHTPLLECVLGEYASEPSEYTLQLRNLDLNDFALALANGVNKKDRDAINTIYALRAGCDYVLDNAEAQKEGSLGTWLGKIKLLRDEIIRWDFWVAVYWLTKPIKDAKTKDNEGYEKSVLNGDYDAKMHYGKKISYWIQNSIACIFHADQVIPMLHAVNQKGDEKELEVMRNVTSYVLGLKSREKGFERVFESLSQRINDYSFWGSLYCLYWMKLRPTPWSDQKVWPINTVQKTANVSCTPSAQQTPKADSVAEGSAKISCGDFAKKLRDAYAKNYAPFNKLWIYNKTTLVFDDFKDSHGGKTVAIDVAVLPEEVKVTLFMRDGSLDDVQAFVNGFDQLKGLFPEIVAQRLRRSKVPHAEVPGFIDKFLAALRRH